MDTLVDLLNEILKHFHVKNVSIQKNGVIFANLEGKNYRFRKLDGTWHVEESEGIILCTTNTTYVIGKILNS